MRPLQHPHVGRLPRLVKPHLQHLLPQFCTTTSQTLVREDVKARAPTLRQQLRNEWKGSCSQQCQRGCSATTRSPAFAKPPGRENTGRQSSFPQQPPACSRQKLKYVRKARPDKEACLHIPATMLARRQKRKYVRRAKGRSDTGVADSRHIKARSPSTSLVPGMHARMPSGTPDASENTAL